MPADNTTNKIKFDISELKSGITESNRLIKLAKSEFNAAASSMDNWQDSTEGLEAKIKQLNTVQEQERKKLKSLKDQYALVAAEQGKNSAGAIKLKTQINNQEAAVNKVTSELNKYDTRLGEVKTAQAEAERTGASLKDVLKRMDDAVSDAATGADDLADGYTTLKDVFADFVSSALSAAVEGFKDLAFESGKAMDKLQAATGASSKEMGSFRSEIYDLYKNNYGDSLEDLGDKFAYIKQVTGETDPSKIKDLTKNAINLETVFGSDFNETVRGVKNLMQHFGLSSEKAFDLFAKGSQNGLDYTDELGDNIAEYGGNFAQAGYSAEDYFQLLENGTQGGAYNLDKVNDSINEVKNRLGDGTIEKNISLFSTGTQDLFKKWQNGDASMKDVIDSIVGDISNCTNEQEALNMAAVAFGTMGEDANLDVVKSLTTLGDSYKNVKGKADEIDKIAYDNLGSALEGLGRSLKTELLQPIVDKVEPALTKFVTWVINNLPTLKPIIVGVAAAFSVLAGALLISNLITAVQKAFALLNLTMLANPIVLIVAAIAGLVAAFIYLWNTSDKFREFWVKVWNTITHAFGVAKTKIVTGFKAVVDFFKSVPGKIADAVKSAPQKIVDLGNKLKQKGKEAAQKLLTAIKNKAGEIPGKLASAVKGSLQKIVDLGNNLKQKGKDAAQKLLTAIKDKAGEIPGKLTSIGGDVVKGLWNGINNKVSWLKGKIKGFVGNVESWLKKFFGIGSPSKLMADEVGRWLPEGIAVGISDHADSALKAMQSLGDDMLDGMGLNGMSLNGMSAPTIAGAAGGSATTNYYTFNQTNNSPTALSRIDIYRQTQNQLKQLKRLK